jgi:homocysteine S-methyltransferase
MAVTATEAFHERLMGGRFITGVQIRPSTNPDCSDHAASMIAADELGVDLVLAAADGERIAFSSTSLALHLREGVSCETAAMVETWNRTIMTLQADLLGAHVLGLRTIVCQTGYPPPLGGYPNADGIWDVDSVGLISLLAALNTGSDCSGLPMANMTSFLIGARCNPGVDDIDAEVHRAREKLEAGAEFLVTRPVFDPQRCLDLIDGLGGDQASVLVTINPLTSFAQAEFLAHEVPDAFVASRYVERMRLAGGDAERAGIDIARETAEAVAKRARGIIIGGVSDRAIISELIGTSARARSQNHTD